MRSLEEKDRLTQPGKPSAPSMEKTLVLAFTQRFWPSCFYEFQVMSDDIYFLMILVDKIK